MPKTCGTINSVDGPGDYDFNKNVYCLNPCDHNFFLDFDATTYEQYDEHYHNTTLKAGKYCQFCKGTKERGTVKREAHDFHEVVDAQLGNNRFYVHEHCDDCGYETSEYVTAKSVISSYYGNVDGEAHTLTVSDLSDSGVKTSIRYGTSADKEETNLTDENGKAVVPPTNIDYTDINGYGELDGYSVTVENADGAIEKAYLEYDRENGKITVTLPENIKIDDYRNRVTIIVLNKADNTPATAFSFSVSANASTKPTADTTELSVNDNVESKTPLSPKGNMTVVDDVHQITDTSDKNMIEDKQFITVESKNGNVFYIIIDRSGDTDNVYFLNAVDEADLLSLLDDEQKAELTTVCTCTDKCEPGKVDESCSVCSKNIGRCIGKETAIEKETESKTEVETEKENDAGNSKGNSGSPLIGLIILALLGGGGAFYWFKIKNKKPSTKGTTDPTDYEEDEEDTEYETEPDEENEDKPELDEDYEYDDTDEPNESEDEE